jgi:hypothetical protein
MRHTASRRNIITFNASVRQPDARHQTLQRRLGAEGVESSVNLDQRQAAVVLLVGPFKVGDSLASLAQGQVDECEVVGRDIRVRLRALQL